MKLEFFTVTASVLRLRLGFKRLLNLESIVPVVLPLMSC
jgi:hypothetical protein